jgi:hypothetical protein
MAAQLHRRFSDKEVRRLMKSYELKEIQADYLMKILGLKKTRFFELVNIYRNNPDKFSIRYARSWSNRTISKAIEKNILKELTFERKMIGNPEIPIKRYNYSYIRNLLHEKYHQQVSVPTIIDRAKKNGFYIPGKKKKTHEREVLTNYVGELIQHDSSFHKWAPYSEEKWYLITSIDDYSRMLLYAEFVKKETTWAHILALQSVLLRYGAPFKYYADSHSIFRFVQGRDSIWREHKKVTDEAVPQWKQVLYDCNIKITHSLSPQAHGKVERPYGWMQDRIVRTCVRENIRNIEKGRDILRHEVNRYNYHQLHSTTLEIPWVRFRRAVEEKRSLFREFSLKPPYHSLKDIFCLRTCRTIDKYKKVSFNNMQFKLPDAPIMERVELRISPDEETGRAEIRFWYRNKLLDVKTVKNEDVNLLRF